jgi:serine/threonine protein kinase
MAQLQKRGKSTANGRFVSDTTCDHRRCNAVATQGMAIALIVAAAALMSMYRLNPMAIHYVNGPQTILAKKRTLRLFRQSTNALTSSEFNRVVYLYPNEANEERTTNSGNRSAHPDPIPLPTYPLKLRLRFVETKNSSDIREEFMDETRYYDRVDSKDTPGMERRRWPLHDFDPHCAPSAQWQTTFYPVCNEIHASLDFRQAIVDEQFALLSSKGFWRHAWRYDVDDKRSNTSRWTNATSPTTVWKTFKLAHSFQERYYEDTRVDAVAMERLTASPYVVRIYGYCGLSIVQEFGSKVLSQVLDDGKMKADQKLALALQIATGVADIHSIRGDDGRFSAPSLVHNDINMANMLFTRDNRPILNDFNIAILVMKHNQTGESCPFYSNFPNPQWKSPEEQVVDGEEIEPPIVSEKIDIYALGNVLFRLAVGSAPWKRPDAERLHSYEKAALVQLKRYNGSLPIVPHTVLENAKVDPALERLLAAMRLCYSFNPAERPTANQIVDFLSQPLL